MIIVKQVKNKIQGKNDNTKLLLLLWQKVNNKQYKLQEKKWGKQNNTRRSVTTRTKEERKKNYSQQSLKTPVYPAPKTQRSEPLLWPSWFEAQAPSKRAWNPDQLRQFQGNRLEQVPPVKVQVLLHLLLLCICSCCTCLPCTSLPMWLAEGVHTCGVPDQELSLWPRDHSNPIRAVSICMVQSAWLLARRHFADARER